MRLLSATIFCRFALALLVLVFARPVTAAELTWMRYGSGGPAWIFLEGPILAGDEERFRQLVLQLLRDEIVVQALAIYSSGGSVPPALHIGRQVRALGMGTLGPSTTLVTGNLILCGRRMFDQAGKLIPLQQQRHWTQNGNSGEAYRIDKRCVCHSACFLIWAAGTPRTGSSIGIHRPFFNPEEYAKLAWPQAQIAYGQMLELVKTYLKEMDVPESLVHKMIATDSENITLVTAEEIKLLWNGDAAASEFDLAKCGRMSQFQALAKQIKSLRGYEQAAGRVVLRVRCSTDLYKDQYAERVKTYLLRFGR